MTINAAALSLVSFSSWANFLAYLAGDGNVANTPRWIWYRAPLDRNARLVRVVRIFKNGKVRLDPCNADADAFNADAGHIDRVFLRREITIVDLDGVES